MLAASIVVTNYNGAELLAQNLPAVLEAARRGGAGVIVCDDASTDNSREVVRRRFPEAQLVAREKNEGFGPAANTGVQAGEAELVVLLNADMRPEPDFLGPLLAHFGDERVFAVMAQERVPTPEGPFYRSAPRGEFRRGFFRQRFETSGQPFREATLSFFASGGASAFRRDRFLALGGFDPLYAPFYWEDVDLSVRAWRRGWRVLFEPRSLVVHRESSTISSRFDPSWVRVVSSRNAWLMVWKNALDRELVLNHLVFAGPSLIWNLLRGNRFVAAGLYAAVARWPLARARRGEELRARVLSDREILKQCQSQR